MLDEGCCLLGAPGQDPWSLRIQGPLLPSQMNEPSLWSDPPWAGDPHHALAVIYARQILLKLLPNLEVHDVVSKSAQRADDHMVAVLHDLFVWLQQVGDFAQGHIDICRGPGREGQRVGPENSENCS